MRVKWLLTGPDGRPMIQASLEGIHGKFDRKIFVINKRIVEEYGLKNIQDVIEASSFTDFEILVLDKQTESQAETVREAIVNGAVTGSIYIKDTDNYFNTVVRPGDFVSVYDLNQRPNIKYDGKCYVRPGTNETILEMREKEIISSVFGCGGYGFQSAEEFTSVFDKTRSGYISEIINQMIQERGRAFNYRFVSDYKDWGDLESWTRHRKQYNTLFIDIDGVIFENSGQYSDVRWGESLPIQENIDEINRLFVAGHTQIILTTARPEDFRKKTLLQLANSGVKYHVLIMGLWHCKRILINDYSTTNPYKSCASINVKRNGKIKELLEGEL